MTINLQDLRESNEFLNHILDNMGAALLIADENFRIHQFNDSFLTLFDSAAIVPTIKTFGEFSGCVNAVREDKPCGAGRPHFCSYSRMTVTVRFRARPSGSPLSNSGSAGPLPSKETRFLSAPPPARICP